MQAEGDSARQASWLERNEPWLRALFRVAAIVFFFYAGSLLSDLHRYRGGTDIRDLERDVSSIQRDVAQMRERMDRR